MNRYDDLYRQTPDVFGPLADPILERFTDLIDSTRPVLDIGCGQGRNSLFLARRGIAVHALDPSAEAVRTVAEGAEHQRLSIQTVHGGFDDVVPVAGGFGTILVFGLIPDLRREQVSRLAAAVEQHLGPGGLLFITAFGTWDPSYERHRSDWTEAEENSYCSLDGLIRTYLEPGELAALFPAMTVLHSWEGLGPEHRHGDGPLERHGRAEAVLRQTTS